jgi:hypothetical protein
MREREVTTQGRLSKIQIGTIAIAAIAAAAAAWSAYASSENAKATAQGVRRTADESRLKTAVDALSADDPTLRA